MESNDSDSLQILVSKNKLTKSQEEFNNLIKRVSILESEIKKETEYLNSVFKIYSDNISPLNKEISTQKLKLAYVLDSVFYNFNFSKNHEVDFELVISSLLIDAFIQIPPYKEQEELHNRWAKVSYTDFMNNVKEQEKKLIRDCIKNKYQIEIDISKYDNSPEGISLFRNDINKLINKDKSKKTKNNEHSFSDFSEKKQKNNVLEDLKSKNIRDLYITLAKTLHPDSETDVALKVDKEELMKKVTVAYEKKDLNTLLKLELEWIHNTKSKLNSITDQKLKSYISTLKDQIKALEIERINLHNNPRFKIIYPYLLCQESNVKKEIKQLKTELKKQSEEISKLTRLVKKASHKNAIIEIVSILTEYYEFDKYKS